MDRTSYGLDHTAYAHVLALVRNLDVLKTNGTRTSYLICNINMLFI